MKKIIKQVITLLLVVNVSLMPICSSIVLALEVDSALLTEVEENDGIENLEKNYDETSPSVSGSDAGLVENDEETLSVSGSDMDGLVNKIEVQSYNVDFAGGDGTEENPYQVATAEQLNAVRNNMDACYIQVADIDLGEWNWEPIGYRVYDKEAMFRSIDNEFMGSYNGNGYKIFNLVINIEECDYITIGLFGFNDGKIENVTIEQCNINVDLEKLLSYNQSHGGSCIGGIVGLNTGEIITNCFVSGKINVSNAYEAYVGGISGRSECSDSINDTDINVVGIVYGSNWSGDVCCGGIVGETFYTNGAIVNCVNYGNVMASADTYLKCGGITGIAGEISDCINYGDVQGKTIAYKSYSFHANCAVGGIAGGIYYFATNCINYGNITSLENDGGSCSAGAICGSTGSFGAFHGKVSNSFNLGQNITSATDNLAGRIVGGGGNVISCYSVDSTLVNDGIPTETGINTPNGKSLTEKEIIAAINGETILKPLPDLFSQDMIVPIDEYWILVMDENATPISDAEINIAEDISYVYENGIIKLKANDKSVWITAEKKDKQTYFNWFTLLGGGSGYIKLIDSVPTLTATVTNVILEEKQKSLMTDQVILYEGDPSAPLSYNFTVYWEGNEPDVYELQQSGEVIAWSSTNQITAELMNTLSVDKGEVAIVLKKDGKMLCKQYIHLKLMKEPEGEESRTIEYGSKLKIDKVGEDIPIFGGGALSMDTMVRLPVKIELEENKAKIYVGEAYDLMDIGKDAKNQCTYDEFINKVQKEWAFAKGPSKFGGEVAGFKVSINFVGYGEGEVDPYTNVIQAKVGVYGKITGKNGITWYTFIGPVPIYAKVTGKVEDKITAETELVIKNGKILNSSVNIDNELAVEVGAGAGIGLNDIVCTDLTGTGTLKWITEGTPLTVDKNEISLQWAAKFRVVLLFLSYEKEWKQKEPWILYSSETESGGGSAWSLRSYSNGDIYDESAYHVLSRDYILDSNTQNASFFSERARTEKTDAHVIIDGLYPDAKPQLVAFDGQTYLFYLDDQIARVAEDRTALVYRMWTGTDWSEPVIVQDDQTADFDFEACAGDDGIYVIWQNAIKSMAGITSLQEAAACLNLQTARIREDEIVLLNQLGTTAGMMPLSPSVVCYNGKAYACWYENSSNDILQNANGKNVFYVQGLEKTGVVQCTCLGETELGVSTVDFGIYKNALCVAFTGDVDGDLNTAADREIYLLQDGSVQRLTDNKIVDSNPQIGILGNRQVIVYYTDGNLVIWDGESAERIFNEGESTLSDDFQFASEAEQPVIIWKDAYLVGENAGQALTAVCYKNGEWTAPVQVVTTQDSLVAFSILGQKGDNEAFGEIVYTVRGEINGTEITRLYEAEARKTGSLAITKLVYEEDDFASRENFPWKLR